LWMLVQFDREAVLWMPLYGYINCS